MSEFRRRLMMQKMSDPNALPDGCVRCKYLESFRSNNQGQYIDTGRKMLSTDVFQVTSSARLGENSDYSFFGWRLGTFKENNQCLASFQTNNVYLLYGLNDSSPYRVSITSNEQYVLFVNPNEKMVCFNGSYNTQDRDWSAPYPNGDSTYNVYLFTANNVGVPYTGANVRIYDYWVKDKDGKEVQHLVPILDANGVPCMYDLVGKQFYYNQRIGLDNFRYEIL